MRNIELFRGDCLELMKGIPDGSVDMVLCDLPYGITPCKWDVTIPLSPLWKQWQRIIKENGVIVLFGSEPFASVLRESNRKMFKYDWYWLKNFKTGHLNAHKQPMRSVETISVFYRKQPLYRPQGLREYGKIKNRGVGAKTNRKAGTVNFQEKTGYPDQQLRYDRDKENLHPTQKPVALLEYLIKTYTNPGEVVLDNCMGSGSTGVACVNTGRRFIGMELDEGYFEIAQNRIADAVTDIYVDYI